MAKQRTMQSYMRSGIALLGIGIAVLKLFNAFIFWLLGASLVLFGIYMVSYYAWWGKKYARLTKKVEKGIRKEFSKERVTDKKGPKLSRPLKKPIQKIRKIRKKRN